MEPKTAAQAASPPRYHGGDPNQPEDGVLARETTGQFGEADLGMAHLTRLTAFTPYRGRGMR
ncbi:MAG: hypothetical protein OXC31_23880 [Spirochaetaceae bacterium]|nr:hypothetical protein [Spirochaetaceae bacterium]